MQRYYLSLSVYPNLYGVRLKEKYNGRLILIDHITKLTVRYISMNQVSLIWIWLLKHKIMYYY